MNTENLHELIKRYEEKMDLLYGEEHNELFKWRAMKVWRDEWYKPEPSFASFADRFNAARKEFSLFIDNSRMHPSSGVVKLWEKEPETVESLFYDVLFADAGGDTAVTQDHMDNFLSQYEELRKKHYPGNWSFKQDRHSASVFLAMNDPAFNYVYKSSEAMMMAKYVDFGFAIGTGANFNLSNYYRLCDEIVVALKEHASLLEKHFGRLDAEKYYVDESLHLLAFDLMYCCRTYDYYKGLIAPVTGKTIKRTGKVISLSTEELARQEGARLAKIKALEQIINKLELSCNDCEDISLIGVQVTAKSYGVGTVIDQEINRITVRFEGDEKTFILDKKYMSRPRFENDDDIVTTFTEYGRAQEQIKRLRGQIEKLQD